MSKLGDVDVLGFPTGGIVRAEAELRSRAGVDPLQANENTAASIVIIETQRRMAPSSMSTRYYLSYHQLLQRDLYNMINLRALSRPMVSK